MTKVAMKVNGRARSGDVEGRTLLVHYLREELGLTGTHVGCDTTQCGACTIHMDGKAVKSCTVLAAQADGSEIVTIEGIANGDELHPMQAAFKEHHGLQCGFCTPGIVMVCSPKTIPCYLIQTLTLAFVESICSFTQQRRRTFKKRDRRGI